MLAYVLVCAAVMACMTAMTSAQSTTSGTLAVTRSNKKCIEVQNGNLVNGAQAWLRTCSSTVAAQQWQLVPSSASGFALLRTANNLCLDVPNGNGAKTTRLQVWQCSTSNRNQYFAVENGMLRWNGSPYCLNARSGYQNGYPDGTQLQLWTCDTTNANDLIALVGGATSTPITTTTTTTTSSSTTSTPTTTTPATTNGKPALTSVFDPTRKRMLAWGYDNNAASLMAYGAKIGSYHHWENDRIPQMPARVQYIPTYWGTSKTAQWNTVKATLGNTVPGAVLGFNEPDIATQANMDPKTAASVFKAQLTNVYGVRGSNMVSPAIVWNVDNWLAPFMTECERLGCGIDAIGLHVYIDLKSEANSNVDNAITLLQTRINSIYARFGNRPIVLSELGLTQAGGGTDAQLMDFMVKAARFLDNSPAVLAWALSAVFRKGQGWDGFLNSNMAFFDANGALTTLGKRYIDETF